MSKKSIQAQLLDIHDELALDLDELKALARLVGEQAEDINRRSRPGLGGLFERIHESLQKKHSAIGELFRIPEKGNAA